MWTDRKVSICDPPVLFSTDQTFPYRVWLDHQAKSQWLSHFIKRGSRLAEDRGLVTTKGEISSELSRVTCQFMCDVFFYSGKFGETTRVYLSLGLMIANPVIIQEGQTIYSTPTS